jgi:hypothetical protein
LTSLTSCADDLGSFDPQLKRSYESILAASPEVSNRCFSTLSLNVLLSSGKFAFKLEGSLGIHCPGRVEAAFWKSYLSSALGGQNSSRYRARGSFGLLNLVTSSHVQDLDNMCLSFDGSSDAVTAENRGKFVDEMIYQKLLGW